MKQITFLLFGPCSSPGGGYKIIFEHANRLVQDGFKVNIVCPISLNWQKGTLYYKIQCIYAYFLRKYKIGYDCSCWFPIDKRIKFYLTYSLNYRHVPKSDIYIATEVQTAPYLDAYPIEASRKFYFIQDYENWFVSDEQVRRTYHYKMNKFVITNWLKDIIETEESEKCILIPNGFDFEEFKITKPIESRNKYTISMLYHNHERKDCKTAIEALDIVKQKYPQIIVLAFGACPNPGLPDWYIYHQRPNSEEHLNINNEAAIYVGSSKIEGFGLTVGESMLCGEAVACTNNLGYQEMAKHEKTALLSPIKNPQLLAENIIKLINNNDLRTRLAYNGMKFIKGNFAWDKSHALLVNLITQN